MTQNQGIAKAFCAQRFNDQAHGLYKKIYYFPIKPQVFGLEGQKPT